MVGALSASVVDSPCLCLLDSLPSTVSVRNSTRLSGQSWRSGSVELGSSSVDCSSKWRVRPKRISGAVYRRSRRQQRKDRSFGIVNELGGQYEDSFGDVKVQILNYFTYKAVRTVMHQLYEMDPTQYRWLYDFVTENKPTDGKRFLRLLGKERQNLAERVMVTRLHLYGKWVKKCDHAAIYKEISDENLELMRERLIETVIWPADDTNTEKIG